MTIQTILSNHNNTVLFEGNFESFNACLEQAVLDKIDLSNANLRNRNLTNTCLDDGQFSGADFSGSNLTGTNLSESNLARAYFKNSDLYNTCFAYADLKLCDFRGAIFGATDITGADISASLFSSLSCFTLDFSATSQMINCRYANEQGNSLTMSRPPVVIRGLGHKPIVFAEAAWMLGNEIRPYPEQFHPIAFLREELKSLS